MRINTSELTDTALDWAVATCEGVTVMPGKRGGHYCTYKHGELVLLQYSTDWAQGGPIIEREGITVSKEDGAWSAYFRENLFEDDGSEHWQTGPTPLIAAMRVFVASKLGDEVEIPEELK